MRRVEVFWMGVLSREAMRLDLTWTERERARDRTADRASDTAAGKAEEVAAAAEVWELSWDWRRLSFCSRSERE